jgi:hypothetical protein
MAFTLEGLRARSSFLDAVQTELDALPPATSGRESALQKLMMARQMLSVGNVRAAHIVARDVCSLLEREGRSASKLERLSQITHATK